MTDLVPAEPPSIQLGSLTADTPRALVNAATIAAKELQNVIRRCNLSSNIQGREYVNVEGWLTLATMMGCLPAEVSNEPREDGSYVAVVELRRMSDGSVLSRASAECGGPEERMWDKRPPYARRSMAATRATGKACRLAFSWVIALAGYATTPTEEMEACAPEPVSVISEAQRKRLRALQRDNHVSDADLKTIVLNAGFRSSKEITRDAYNDICDTVERLGRTAESDNQANQDWQAEYDAAEAEGEVMQAEHD